MQQKFSWQLAPSSCQKSVGSLQKSVIANYTLLPVIVVANFLFSVNLELTRNSNRILSLWLFQRLPFLLIMRNKSALQHQ